MGKNENPSDARSSLWCVCVCVCVCVHSECASALRALSMYIYSRIVFETSCFVWCCHIPLLPPYVTLIKLRRSLHNSLWFAGVSWSYCICSELGLLFMYYAPNCFCLLPVKYSPTSKHTHTHTPHSFSLSLLLTHYSLFVTQKICH